LPRLATDTSFARRARPSACGASSRRPRCRAVVNGKIITGRYLPETSYVVEIELTMPDLFRLTTSWTTPRLNRLDKTTRVTITKPTAMLAHLYEIVMHLKGHKVQIIESYEAVEVAIAMSLDIEKGMVPDELFGSLKEVKKMLFLEQDFVQTEVDHRDDLVDLRVGHSSFAERKAALTSQCFRSLFRRRGWVRGVI
jgi:hypothetical protein